MEDLLELIDEPNGSICARMLSDNKAVFQRALGSSHNHQAWPGGYLDHILEVMNIAFQTYSFWNGLRPLPFSLSDVLLILFLHDIEKPWKYAWESGGLCYRRSMSTKADHHQFRMKKVREYGIAFTLEQEEAFKYVEGEGEDHSRSRRVMSPLAAMAHICDIMSARIWFDHPLEEGDPWQ